MEHNANPTALLPQGVDQEVFDRVWRRVMPDQEQSPIALNKGETDEISPPSPISAPPPRQPPCPTSLSAGQEEPPFCLSSQSQDQESGLRAQMDLAREGLLRSQALIHRSGSYARVLSDLTSDHRRALRQLSAAYFLITGRRYRPSASFSTRWPSLPLALRDQFLWEQQWERSCQRAAAGTEDPCLKELYLELARDGACHAASIRSLLEQMS